MTVELNPTAQDHFQLGMAAVQAGDLETAVGEFQAVVETQPSHLESRYRLGWVLASLGEREKAIQEFRQVLQLQPDHAEANYNLGAVLLQKAQLESTDEEGMSQQVLQEAKASFEKVLEKDPFDQKAFAFLTLINRAMEQYTQSETP